MNEKNSPLGDEFDRTVRGLTGLPDTIHTSPATKRTVTPVLNLAQTWIVQTYRQKEMGDTILIEYVAGDGHLRIAIPPAVADLIARQRDALTGKNRRRGAQQAVETRKALGIQPGFLKNRGRGGRKGKASK